MEDHRLDNLLLDTIVRGDVPNLRGIKSLSRRETGIRVLRLLLVLLYLAYSSSYNAANSFDMWVSKS